LGLINMDRCSGRSAGLWSLVMNDRKALGKKEHNSSLSSDPENKVTDLSPRRRSNLWCSCSRRQPEGHRSRLEVYSPAR
jgi:hypothetical protein